MDSKNDKSIKKEKEEAKRVVNLGFGEEYEYEDLEKRRLYLNSEVDECVIDSMVYHILRFNREDKEAGVALENRRPILLYLNTPGGNVIDGYGLIDAIRCSKTPVYTINQALCASMGFLIFIAGHKRYSMPSAEFLMHDGSTFSFGSTSKVQDRMTFEKEQLEVMTKNYVMDRTKIDEKMYDEKYRVEWYFLPEEAFKLGVVDYIVGRDCDIDDIV